MTTNQILYYLENWSNGDTEAERFCADLLLLNQFTNVDPQSTLGGPDEKKDILCEKDGVKYVVAAYFPQTSQSFANIKSKFKQDLTGVTKNQRQGIVFFVNKHLTLKQREKLQEIATTAGAKLILFHRERLRTILETPIAYGIREKYFKILPTPSEITAAKQQLQESDERTQNQVKEQLRQELYRTRAQLVTYVPSCDLADVLAALSKNQNFLYLTPQLLCLLHRAVCSDLPSEPWIGQFRTELAWIGEPNSTADNATFVPVEWDEIPILVEKLLYGWICTSSFLEAESTENKLRAIASFHFELLRIHPFKDRNGTLARLILFQQYSDFIDKPKSFLRKSTPSYVAALEACASGDLEQLVLVIRKAFNCL